MTTKQLAKKLAKKIEADRRNKKLAEGLNQAHTLFCISSAIGFIARLLG